MKVSITIALAALAAALLSGCAAIERDQAAARAQNQQQCQSYGLTPGSSAYVQCVSQGAAAYAQAQKNAAAPRALVIAPAHANNACEAPASSPRGTCSGCSVSCGDKQASCTAGEEWPGGSESCLKSAVCECH